MSQDAHEIPNPIDLYPPYYYHPKEVSVDRAAISDLDTAIKLLDHARAFVYGGNLKLAAQAVATVRDRLNLMLRDMEP